MEYMEYFPYFFFIFHNIWNIIVELDRFMAPWYLLFPSHTSTRLVFSRTNQRCLRLKKGSWIGTADSSVELKCYVCHMSMWGFGTSALTSNKYVIRYRGVTSPGARRRGWKQLGSLGGTKGGRKQLRDVLPLPVLYKYDIYCDLCNI